MMYAIIGLLLLLCFGIGTVAGIKADKYRTMFCPYNNRWQLKAWATSHYPDTPQSYFEKKNKTYLISLWYVRPPKGTLPTKVYNKEENVI